MKHQKGIFLFLLIGLLATMNLNAQHSNRLSRVKVYVSPSSPERLEAIRLLELDHFIEQEGYIVAEIGPEELEDLKRSGLRHQVIVSDIAAELEIKNRPYFEGRRNGTVNMDGTPVNAISRVAFEQPGGLLGNIINTPSAFVVQPTFGGYYSYAQMVTAIEALYNTYSPAGIVDTFHVGLSYEGRMIYAVKISDNVTTDEANEPEVFFQGIQHAREAIGGSSMIFMMQYLCEKYSTDTRIRDIVDNREIYIIVCMNPDGWEYNRNNGGAGAAWRKNRKNNVGSYGIDLNRNWNVDWANCTGAVGAASCGSSTPSSDTYWGTAAFSEPETQAVRNFIRSKHIVVANDQHSFGPYFSLPYGRPNLHTSDPLTATEQNWYTAIPALMGKYNGMRAGNSLEALGYEVAGGVKDWFLKGDLGTGINGGLKTNIMGMTGEGGYRSGVVGSSFWPQASEIVTLCKGMLYQNLQMIYSAGSYVDIQDNSDIALTTTSGNFSFRLKRLGLENQPVTVSVVPVLNVQSVGTPVTVTTLSNYYDTYTGNIGYVLPAGITNGQQVKFAWHIQTAGYSWKDTITKFFNPTTLLYDNMEGTLTTNWTNENEGTVASGFGYNYTGANWTFTTGGYGGSQALSESANGTDYSATSIRRLRYNSTFNLTSATAAYLTFLTRHEMENSHDKVQVQISTNGTTWTAITGKTTIQEEAGISPTNADGSTINGKPALTGIAPDWVKEEFNLATYLGQPTVYLRFEFTSDQSTTFYKAQDEGFFIDELKVISSNTPLITLAANFLSFSGKLQNDNTIELKWDASVDQKHRYFEVEKSSDRISFVSIGKVAEGREYRLIDRTPYIGNNFYRIRAVDSEGVAKYSNVINVNYNPDLVYFQTYPNPVSDQINVRLKTQRPELLYACISDMMGKVVSKMELVADDIIKTFTIDTRTLVSNMYVLRIVNVSNETIGTQKFVKR